MRKFVDLVVTMLFFLLCSSVYATVIFSSKWDSPGSGVDYDSSGNPDPNDGGAWRYAYTEAGSGSELLRVSGDQSSLGGPTGVPGEVSSNTTYYVRCTMVPTANNDYQQYLQPPDFPSRTDLYMGMWVYFESGTVFYDSVKWMDFRTYNQAVGNGHLALFGLQHKAEYCANTNYSSADYINDGYYWTGSGSYHNLIVYRYLSVGGSDIRAKEGNLNYYDYSATFDANMNTSGVVVPRASYTPSGVNHVQISGGKWMAFIVRAKISSTDGAYEAWIKDGTSPLRQVMKWNRDTVWSGDNSTPHDLYTINGTGAIEYVQANAYWNVLQRTQRVWISNFILATTLNEVQTYLGVSNPAPNPPTNLRIIP